MAEVHDEDGAKKWPIIFFSDDFGSGSPVVQKSLFTKKRYTSIIARVVGGLFARPLQL